MKYAAIDIGNVCVAIDKTVPFREIGFDINAPECEKLFDLVRLMEWGKINEDDFFARLSEMPECRKKNKDELKKLFNSILIAPVPGMRALLRELPSLGVMPVFFSDISTCHLEDCRRMFPEMRCFDGIYSFDFGAYKPSAKLFDAFEEKYGKPLIYTDDRQELIDGAAANNWNAHCFVSATELREQIVKLLLQS